VVPLNFSEDVNLDGEHQCHDNGSGYNLDI